MRCESVSPVSPSARCAVASAGGDFHERHRHVSRSRNGGTISAPDAYAFHVEGRLALLSAVVISAVLAGCTSSAPRPSASAPFSGPNLGMPVYMGGTVVGGIYPCSAVPPSISVPPKRVAGTVDVFTPGSSAAFAEGSVAAGGTYSFNLPPGRYVLVAHWAGSNVSPPMVNVIVVSGEAIRQDLDYEGCK